jgi:hypothetical protein
MKKQLITIGIMSLLIGSANLAQGTLMQTTWTGTIGNISSNAIANQYLHDGEKFFFQAIYDDKQITDHASIWNDGANGVAEFGKGDDMSGGSVSGGKYADDVNFTFSANFQTYLQALPDTTSYNSAYVKIDDQLTPYGVTVEGDGFRLDAGVATNTYSNWIGFWERQSPGVPGVVHVGAFGVTNVQVTNTLAPVPEPGTMVLFGIGLAGIATGNRRKNKL